jgi:tetratricopeptide (TPR) repeat protein
MKRILLFFTATLIVSSLFAQTSKQVNFNSLQKKVDKSVARTEHEKRGLNYKTWLSHGELMKEVYDAMILSARAGMTVSEFNIIVGMPNQQNEKEVDGQVITEYVMDRVNFYFINGMLEYWKFTNNLVEKPLHKAYESFLKAKELDEKGKAEKSLKDNLNQIKYLFIGEGTSYYSQKEYIGSFKCFAKAIEIGENPIVSFVDTIVIYYAGLSAQVGGDFENAVTYYKKALDYNFTSDGNIYYNIYEALTQMEKQEEAVKYLQDGFLKHPKNQSILYGLINYYISKGDDPKLVLEYIHKAMETDPTEPSLYFAEGTLHDKLENIEEAEKSYKKAIELNPNFFDALYNIGALYFNSGVRLLEEANKIPAREIEKYDQVMIRANGEFKKSIPYMEKAYEIDSMSRPVVETLRNLYFRFRTEGDEMQKKYDRINEHLQTLE